MANIEDIFPRAAWNGRNRGQADAEREQDAPAQVIQLGQPDPNGANCTKIWFSTKPYTVYEVEGGAIRHVIHESYDKAKAYRDNYFKISDAHLRVEYLRKEYHGDPAYVNRVIARSVAQAFDGRPDEAGKQLEELRSKMEASVASRRRMNYVKANGLGCLLIVSALVALSSLICVTDSLRGLGWYPFSLLTSIDLFPFDRSVVELYLKLFILGALGALLSVSVGIKKIQIPDETTHLENRWTGAARILIGVLGAMFMGLTFDAGLFLANINSASEVPTYYVFAFLAGFSETLVPNALRSTEQSAGASGTA